MGTILAWLSGSLVDLLKPACSLYAKLFNPLVAIALVLYEFTQWLAKTITGVELKLGQLEIAFNNFQAAVGQAAFGAFPTQILNLLAFVNYMVPLTEAIALTGLLCTLHILCTMFRIVKSWIPSVAS